MAEFEIDENHFSKLKDKVVIITGGHSGIGLGTVELFASHGAKVIIADLEPPEDDIPNTSYVHTDVTSWVMLLTLFRDVCEKFGQIDVVFANAGVARSDDYLDPKIDEKGELIEPSHRTLHINLLACINTVVIAIHYMKKQKEGGSIIVTASASSYQRFIAPDYSQPATAKHGVLGFMRSLFDLLPTSSKIRINAISPSWTDTRLVPKAALAAIGIAVQPTSVVARSVALLAVDENRHGQCIYSSDGKYRELEGPVLEMTERFIGEEVSEGEAALRLGFGGDGRGARKEDK